MSTLRFDVTQYDETIQALSQLPFIPETWIFNAGDCEYMDDGIVDAQLMARVMNVNVVGVPIVSKRVRGNLNVGIVL